MLPSLLVAVTITAPAAPTPKDAVPNTSGPAPRIVAVKADANGMVWITAQIWEKRKVQQQFFVVENGKQVMKQREVEQPFSTYIHKAINDFGATFSTADGLTLSTDEAARRLKDGATLLVTANGKPIDKAWLRAVDGDTVIMQADGLAHAHFQYNQTAANSALPTTASPRLVLLCADEKGAVKVAVNPTGGMGNANSIYYEDLGGGRVIRGRAVAWQGNLEIEGSYASPQADGQSGTDNRKPLTEVKFDAYDIGGKLIPRAEALKRLKAGGLVLLASDNRFPDGTYLKAFRDDILVLASGEFVFPQGMPNPYDLPVKSAAAPPGPGRADPVIWPAPAMGLAAPALQLRVVPAAVQQLPVAPAPKPEAKPAAKPAAKGG
jgi:hypothetical protein